MPRETLNGGESHAAADCTIVVESSVVLFLIHSERARDWLVVNCNTEPWQWLGKNIAMDTRCAIPIIGAMQREGLVLQ